MTRRLFAAAIAAIFISGCFKVGPNYRRPQSELPQTWSQSEATAAVVPPEWFRIYNDPVLDRMAVEALAHNADLELALARVDEARAALGVVRASLFPNLNANASGLRNKISEESPNFFPGLESPYNDLTASLVASWEIDLWGRFRRATEAARAELFAQQANRDAVRLTLLADVSRGYFNLRALDAQVEVTRRTVKTRLDSLALQQKRFDAGAVSELELRQIEAETAAAQALLPQLEAERTRQETALAVLLGKSPRDIIGGSLPRGVAIETIPVPPVVPPGLPSALLERRPDLREAEQRLVASNARIGVAKTAYFPAITLTGLLGGESSSLADLFTSSGFMWQYSATAAQTIFDWGKVRFRVKGARARQKQELARYRAAVQNAFKEIHDALVAQRKARETLMAQEVRVAALEKALELAKLRYRSGESSLLDALDSERGLLEAKLNRIAAQRTQLSSTADLIQALGGGWNPDEF